MSGRTFKAVKCPSEDLSLTNAVIVNEQDFEGINHVNVNPTPHASFLFTVLPNPRMAPGQMGFNAQHRKWASIILNGDIGVKKSSISPRKDCIGSIVLEMDFFAKKNATGLTLDSDVVAQEFSMSFSNRAFTVGEPLVFRFDNGDKKNLYSICVKSIEVIDMSSINAQGQITGKPKLAQAGVLTGNSGIVFEKVEGSLLNFKGKAKGKSAHQSIINPDWDFTKLGIGGLDTEFTGIFRRAFASRVFPPEIIEQLGMKHVRGILLFGPPGTGKTLMARQIGKMLNAREPKIVNGPEILDKYVGESEANIRKLFAPAEEEEKRCGAASGLHIIIFDEIDAICKKRGSVAGNTAVHDTVVNMLLTKLDGHDQLNNILVIGMTNRKDMIDEALTRPGRMEVQMEIGLPNEHGRTQILNIHTTTMRDHDKLADDVDIAELAALSKNFSGAELEGLVRAAQSTAMNRLIKATNKVEIEADAVEKLKICRADFLHALQHDCKPAFGSSKNELDKYLAGGILTWGDCVGRVLEDGDMVTSQIKTSEQTSLITMLLEGPAGAGKTALAAKIAQRSDLPFTKLCTPENMIGYTEPAKCQEIKRIFDDAYKSPISCIIIDDIERLLDYVSIGPRFSNLVLQALLVLLKKLPPKGHKLLIIGTTSSKHILQDFDMLPLFKSIAHVSAVTTSEQLCNVLDSSDAFTDGEMEYIKKKTAGKRIFIGIKTLLSTIEMAKQISSGERGEKLVCLLEDRGSIEF